MDNYSTGVRSAAVAAALAMTGVTAAAGGAAAAPPDPCTRGSAQQVVNAGIVAANQIREGRTHTGIVTSYRECAYTLYEDGATYTFSDDDVFAGVTAFTWWRWEEEDGMTRDEVVDIIAGTDYRVELAQVSPDGTVGDLVEVPVLRPPVRFHPMLGQGLTAYQTAGVILDLDPGTYVSRFEAVFPDLEDEIFSAEVTLVVTD
ncbi:hypothetical protein [Ornithinimicrobium flavum]|uniref:hypothetical protein n=1 Tax=Ornithinimicrobium flavum TaxID=1288636 RepID=UPI00107056EA|nr:hypothetical protein [Ornithinimicrobium flavum]